MSLSPPNTIITAPTISAINALNLSQSISQIYQYSFGYSIKAFRQNALKQLQEILSFDSLGWFIAPQGSSFNPELALVDNLPASFISDFSALINKSSQNALWFNHEEVTACDIHDIQSLKPLSVHNIRMQMLAYFSHNNVHHILILNRANADQPFNVDERAILGFFGPFLFRAFHQCLQAKLMRHSDYRNSRKAIFDKHGSIIEGQNEFTDAIDLSKFSQIWPTETFQQSLKLDYDDRFRIDITKDETFFVAEAYQFDEGIEAFTLKENAIACLLLKGKSYKQIASDFGRSERTIEHQLKSIYTKLGVEKKTEAIYELTQSNYYF